VWDQNSKGGGVFLSFFSAEIDLATFTGLALVGDTDVVVEGTVDVLLLMLPVLSSAFLALSKLEYAGSTGCPKASTMPFSGSFAHLAR
jgi:hypothetical protein